MRAGRIELLEEVEIPEGTEVLVTPLVEEMDFWLKASENSIDAIWDNTEDDVYAKLLKNEVVLVRYPFSNLSGSKVRPAVIINAPHISQDAICAPCRLLIK